MKRLIVVSIVISLLAVSNLFSYLVTKKSGNEIKWRPLPASISYKMNQTEPNSACSTKLKNACKAWEDEGRSNVIYNYAGETSISTVVSDGTNAIVFPRVNSDTTWLAGTYWWYNTSTYALTEFDISVAQKFHWCYTDSPQGDTYDFQSTLTHEFGHSLGSNDIYKYYDNDKTMYGIGYQASTKQRTLEQDDKDLVAYLYPTDSVDKVWIKTATDDYGVVKYPGDVFWQSPDISLKPDPPVLAEPCSVFVTARNMRPDNQTARIIIEVHDPDVSLRARTSVLYTDSLINKTIPPGNKDTIGQYQWYYESWANSKRDGETTFVFVWTPDSNTFGEDHYCMVATVESGSDTLRDLDVPDDNDIACHNFNTVKGGVGGNGQMMSFGAGNPTGVPVWRHLHLEPLYMPSGWMAEMPPFPDSMLLSPTDTFWPVPVIITPPLSALRGDFGIVQVCCTLKFEYDPSLILMTGGIIYKLIAGEPGDVGVTQIKEPTGTINDGSSVIPRAVVKNLGATTETFAANFKIGDVYSDDTSGLALAPGESLEVAFDSWLATIGSYAVSCSTELNNDWRIYNDKQSTTLEVVQLTPGWTQQESMPTGVSGKYVKDGGSLVAVPVPEKSSGALYAFRGNKKKEFYKYDAGWIAKETLLYGVKPTNPLKTNKKQIAKGAALCYDGDNTIYATKGNGTIEFWAYTISDSTWHAKPFVTVPKSLKGGTSIAYLNGKVYLLAGSQKKTDPNNFYVYDVLTNTWTTGPSIALGPSLKPFKDGSCITEMGGVIYALKGGDKGNYFYAYDTTTSTWSASDSMPLGDSLYGKWKKKLLVKDGAAMTNDGSTIYMVKGGGTNVFWKYTPGAPGVWTREDSIPRLHKKSVVKTGGALAYVDGAVWLLKGNNTPEFWKYVPSEKSNVKGQMSNVIQTINTQSQIPNLQSQINIIPNPFTKLTTIQYTMPVSGKISIKLYNTNGELIKILNDGYLNAGSYIMNLSSKNLAKGIYFLRYETSNNKHNIKLIVQ